MADYRAALGRGGDSEMAHMTPGEAVIPRGSMTPKLWAAYQEALDRQGMAPEQYVVGSGQNSINPMTGQPEFLAQAAAPGRSVRDYQDRGGSLQGPESRARGPLVGRFPTSPEMGGLNARRQQQQMIEGVPQDQWASDPSSGQFGQTGTIDLDPLMSLLPGPIDAIMRMAGVDPTVDYFDPMPGHGGSYPDRRSSIGREAETEQGLTRLRTQTQQNFMRPAAVPSPQFLGLSAAMSPLQQRTAIASRAVAGQGGEYTSPEAQSFYDNLLQRSLIGDDSELFGLDTLLPIDLQYLSQIRGIENPADTRALLTSLAR